MTNRLSLCPRRTSALPCASFLLLLSATSAAQLPDFGSIPLASGTTVYRQQSVIAVSEGNIVRCFSALTRTWASFTANSNSPRVILYNEHGLIDDGGSFVGYSARTGRFERSQTTAGVVASTSATAWISGVVDTGAVHVYNGIRGGWTVVSTTGSVTVRVLGYSLSIEDGSGVRAMSPFFAAPLACPAPLASVASSGNMAYGIGLADEVWGYSALLHTWAMQPTSGPPAIFTPSTGGSGFNHCCAQDGSDYHFFCGATGTWATVTGVSGGFYSANRTVATLLDGNTVHFYSAVQGKVVTKTYAAAPGLTLNQYLVAVADVNGIECFSGPFGAISTQLAGQFSTNARAAIVAATPLFASDPTHVYSAVTNRWIAVPNNAGGGFSIGDTFVVIVDASNGLMLGWSALGNQWHPAVAQPAPVVSVSGSAFAARDTDSVWAFNPRTQAWRQQQVGAQPVTVRAGSSGILIVDDGATAWGFSVLNDRWAATPIAGPLASYGGVQYAAVFTDGASVHAYAGTDQIANLFEYPFYSRFATPGCLHRYDLSGAPGSLGMLILGVAPALIQIAPFGELLVDPAVLVTALGTIPAQGCLAFEFTLPPNPRLRGLELHAQGLLLGTSSGYFTNSAQTRIH